MCKSWGFVNFCVVNRRLLPVKADMIVALPMQAEERKGGEEAACEPVVIPS